MSPQLKSLSILATVVLILQVPVQLIRELTRERMETRDVARADVRSTWGGPQTIAGPRLLVPTGPGSEADWVTLLPDDLVVEGRLETVPLRRGLFEVPTYTGTFIVRGTFRNWDVSEFTSDENLAWDQARLVLSLTDPRSIRSDARATWSGEPVPLRPGSGTSMSVAGVHAPVLIDTETASDFEVVLSLQGSEAVYFAPLAEDAAVTLTADWSSPSFDGSWLPVRRVVESSGFEAEWSLPALGRGLPQIWLASAPPADETVAESFGVELIDAIDAYRMAERSTKHAPLFLVLTFGMLWLFDVLRGLRVHPIQYVLVGAAICVFYLLELSLSEHLGFGVAYGCATAATSVLIGAYTKVVLRAALRGIIAGGAVAGLYSYLLLVLTLEQYALLAGSVALFALLAGVMYTTRWIDWYSLDRRTAAT